MARFGEDSVKFSTTRPSTSVLISFSLAMSSEQAASVPAAQFKKLSSADKRAQLSAVDLWPVESVGKDKGGALCLAGTHHPSKSVRLQAARVAVQGHEAAPRVKQGIRPSRGISES